jgi:hypothetical protein
VSVRSTSTFLVLSALAAFGPAPAATQATERLYQEACDGGDLTACNVFGLMYETGQGVPQDLARAPALYQRACEGGELVGCTNVGLLHAATMGTPRDTTRAAGFFRIACEGGEQLGCNLLRALEDVSRVVPAQRFEKAGRVGDVADNRPLSGAVVELPELGVRSVSDAGGRFLLAGVPAGRYTVRAERLGYDPLVGTVEIPGNPDFVMLMTPAEVVDPFAAGQLVGRVMEGGDRGLSSVDISVVGQERARTLSNQQGRFTLRDVEPGLLVVRFSRLGYAPRTATLVVQPGRTAEVSVTMAVQPIELEPVEVTIRSLDLERSGFYDRAARGFGTRFTPGDLERMQPVLLSDALRGRVPGVRVVQSIFGGQSYLVGRRSGSFRLGDCVLPVWIDGVRSFDTDIDQISPGSIAAVEVYQGPGTPPQYGFDACGAVLLWTRRGN